MLDSESQFTFTGRIVKNHPARSLRDWEYWERNSDSALAAMMLGIFILNFGTTLPGPCPVLCLFPGGTWGVEQCDVVTVLE